MTKKHNFHDSWYKNFFSNSEMVSQLLTYFVDEEWTSEIDYSTLQKIDKSFITDEFTGRESDLIFKVYFHGKEMYIFILLEFQSTVDRFMALRMLRYITELYEYLIKSCKIKAVGTGRDLSLRQITYNHPQNSMKAHIPAEHT